MPPTQTVLSVFNLAPRRIGGIETFARELSVQLDQFGWRSVLCFNSSPSTRVSDFLDLDNVVLESEEDLTSWGLRPISKLARLLRQHRPSIVHFYFTNVFGPYAMIAKSLGVKQVLFTDQISRDENHHSTPAPLWKRAAYHCLLPLSNIVCISEYVRNCWVSKKVISTQRLLTIHNSVDVEACIASMTRGGQFRREHSIPLGSVVVTQVANMIPEKGFADLLRAAKLVLARDSSIHFVMAGEGIQRRELEAMAEAFGINRHITFTGLINDPVREGLFSASDIVCQMSRWNEAFGFVIAEAMACGKPIIANGVGAIPELVKDGETGYLIKPGDIEELSQSILRLAADEKLRQALGTNGQSRCKQFFDHHRNVAKLMELYGISQNEQLLIASTSHCHPTAKTTHGSTSEPLFN